MEPTLASVALNALLLHCTVLGADTAWICHSSVLVAFYKEMQLETIGLGLAQNNYRKIIRYDIGYAYMSS